jgi:hypothetical protein
MSLGNAVRALGHDLAALDDHRRKWPTSLGHVLARDVDRVLREIHCQTP